MTITVLLADDQALVRQGLRMLLESEPDIEVVGEASDGLEAVRMASSLCPAVALMDVRMPGMDGIEATRKILADAGPMTRVLILTTFDVDEYVYEALRAGASGFLLKDVSPQVLVAGIRAVNSGQSLLAPSVTRRMIQTLLRRRTFHDAASHPDLAALTPRERETLVLLARGLTNCEIAARFVVSETTVKTHVGRVLMKLDLRDRVQAVIWAYEHGLV